ncbi:EamA family transporter RarD [Thioclava atlantica]|uniref:RarD protein n=1 Tax=Thioclava atlantica TaxID=1317124 RepID=A0A085U1W5_9RHOB|nr:EamA family transporter RarD [Thioclava atlantica]KFE36962.1 RarD protein [Thioclava atlantica]
MSEATKGFWAMVTACVIWGLSGLYYKMLDAVPPIEVLAHRTLWSFLFFAVILAVKGRLHLIRAALSERHGRGTLIIGFAALMISANWFTFIWSVQSGHAVQASLGYYIFPLVAVLLGLIVYREALGVRQWVAVALAATAVVVLTLGLGVAPWVSLILAFSFGTYGLIKKGIKAGPMVSVCAEVLLLSPIAMVVLVGYHYGWWGAAGSGHFGQDLKTSALLAFSGPLTGTPLLLFAYAAQRVRMATVGLVQYLNPTLQFAVATLAFGEHVTLWHAIALGLIWSALAIYSSANLRPRARRVAGTA